MFDLLELYESHPITVNKDPPPSGTLLTKPNSMGSSRSFREKHLQADKWCMWFPHYILISNITVYQIFLFLQKWYCAAEWARGSYRTHRTGLFITHHHSTACKHMAVQRYATCWKDVVNKIQKWRSPYST